MRTELFFDPTLSAEELRGFSRTVAEIEWLLLILVLLYQVVLAPDEETMRGPVDGDVLLRRLRALLPLRQLLSQGNPLEDRDRDLDDDRVHHLGADVHRRRHSPLGDLYLLVVITSALTLGKLATLLEMGLIAACYMWLGHRAGIENVLSIQVRHHTRGPARADAARRLHHDHAVRRYPARLRAHQDAVRDRRADRRTQHAGFHDRARSRSLPRPSATPVRSA